MEAPSATPAATGSFLAERDFPAGTRTAWSQAGHLTFLPASFAGARNDLPQSHGTVIDADAFPLVLDAAAPGTRIGSLQAGHLTFLPANLLGAANFLPQSQDTEIGMGFLFRSRCLPDRDLPLRDNEAQEYMDQSSIAKRFCQNGRIHGSPR